MRNHSSFQKYRTWLGGIRVSGITVALLLILIPGIVLGRSSPSKEEVFLLAFPGTETIEKKGTVLLPAQQEEVAKLSGTDDPPRIFRYLVGYREGQVTGYAVVSTTKGKEDRFKFMVAVSPDGQVQHVEMLSYKGSRGKGVRKKRFRRQFEGKTLSDPLRVSRDIHAVSGATISSAALTKQVRTVLACLRVICGIPRGSCLQVKEKRARKKG